MDQRGGHSTSDAGKTSVEYRRGGAADLFENLNNTGIYELSQLTVAIGRTTHTGEDNVFICRLISLADSRSKKNP